MRKSIAVLMFLPTFLIYGQDVDFECGTMTSRDPNFDPSKFREYLSQIGIRSEDTLYLPVVPHIIRHEDQSGGLDPVLVEAIFDDVNRIYAPGGIQFYICEGINFVDKDILYDFDRGLYLDSLTGNNVPDVINVYFLNKVLNDASVFCGFASFPWTGNAYAVVQNECAQNGSTTAHEIGHYLGLLHTHETALGLELVNGRNCVVAGDEICDTPADPRLGTSNVNLACEYTGQARDQNRDLYKPDPRNIMSYSRKECRDLFTEEQYARMFYYLDRERAGHSCLATSAKPVLLEQNLLKIFPNPSMGLIGIELSGSYEAKEIRISDMMGRTMISFSKPGPVFTLEALSLDVSSLSTGTYLMSVITGDGIVSKKFLLQK